MDGTPRHVFGGQFQTLRNWSFEWTSQFWQCRVGSKTGKGRGGVQCDVQRFSNSGKFLYLFPPCSFFRSFPLPPGQFMTARSPQQVSLEGFLDRSPRQVPSNRSLQQVIFFLMISDIMHPQLNWQWWWQSRNHWHVHLISKYHQPKNLPCPLVLVHFHVNCRSDPTPCWRLRWVLSAFWVVQLFSVITFWPTKFACSSVFN